MAFFGVFVMSRDEEIGKFAETYHITFPVGKDNGTAEALGVRAIPTTLFVGKNGKVLKKYLGSVDYADLSANIGEILK